jgi:hypothetical protein
MQHEAPRLLQLLEGTLDPVARREVERHVTSCEQCAEELRLLSAGFAAARSLAAASRPPASLGTRLHAALHRRRLRRRALAAAAVGAWLLSSFAAYRLGARSMDDRAIDAAATYALFFIEPDWPPAAPLDRDGYAEHANQLRADDRFGGGEKLTDDAGWLVQSDGRVDPPTMNMSGWFLIEALTDDAALDVARRSPHLRWGSILVRKVD